MKLTKAEIAELKAILAARKSAKPKPQAPRGIPKLLVGPHGRIVGRALVAGGAKPPKDHKFINDDPDAKIGHLVKNGKVIKPTGKPVTCDVVKAGKVVNTILVDQADPPSLPKGHKLVKTGTKAEL